MKFFQGRNICETPNELLEVLGIENNNTMRVCRKDDQSPRNIQQQQQQLYTYPASSQQYSSSNDLYNQQQYYPQQQQVYTTYPTNYDQHYMTSPR